MSVCYVVSKEVNVCYVVRVNVCYVVRCYVVGRRGVYVTLLEGGECMLRC